MAPLPKPKRRVIVDPFKGREGFAIPEFQAPIIGDYGRRGVDPGAEFALPAQYSPAALAAMSDGELAALEQQARKAYNQLEQSWRDVVPEGYTGIYDDGAGGLQGPDPRDVPENQQRRQALNMLSNLRYAAKGEQGNRRQTQLRAQNQLAGGLAEQGYELDLRGNAMEELWRNRNNLPGFVKTPGARNFIKRKGQKFAYENTPFGASYFGQGYEGDAEPNPLMPRRQIGNGEMEAPGVNPLPPRSPSPQYAPNTEYPSDGYNINPPDLNEWGAPKARSLRPRTTMASFGLPTQTRIGV